MNKKKMLAVSLYLLTAIVFVGCSKDDDPTNPTEILQPSPIAPDDTYGGTIGFWDFDQTGKNSVSMNVPGRSEDWVINGVGFTYDDQGLIIGENIDSQDAVKNRVQLINSNKGGLAHQYYFSGAIRFKVMEDPNKAFSYPLLSFGLEPRFLELWIWNGKITMRTDNSNIVKNTDVKVKADVWNVLYYRYEGFDPAIGNNNFYLQLNDGAEVVIDLESFDIDDYAGNDSNISLGFSSAGFTFNGNIDWIILGLGRMKPGNAQYLVEDFKK
ncbi:MAG: hypothetical protein N4A59_10140 [Marinifilum sp.]|jgi:hypothetical protein|nr:hypothetical protein [Marinifilum sp.]